MCSQLISAKARYCRLTEGIGCSLQEQGFIHLVSGLTLGCWVSSSFADAPVQGEAKSFNTCLVSEPQQRPKRVLQQTK